MVVVLALGLASRVAYADGASIEIGGFGAAFVPAEKHEFYDWMASTQVPLGTVVPGVGLRIAVFPVRFVGVEVEGEFLRTEADGRDSVNLFGAGGHLIGRFAATPKLGVFGLAGGGVMGLSTDDAVLGKDTDKVAYAGVGVAMRVAPKVDIRVDARLIRAPEAGSDVGTNHGLITIGASGVLGFGDRAPAPPPADDLDVPEPPKDGDGDGIVDADDQCAAQAETVNGFDDTDGCPDVVPDTDGDGIDDQRDKCKAEPEGMDAFQDDDGCPDLDNDGDGVVDLADQCPVPGPPENRGCPDTDKDGDTVIDRLDNCPDEPGTVDNRGCKKKQLVAITPTQIQILDTVHFQSNKSKVLRKSFALLDNVAAVLLAHPEISKVRVEGHTDDRGPDDYNLGLSQRRADAVKAHLVKKGVGADRLEAVGKGEAEPLDLDGTAKSRAVNRRVEFDIVDPAIAPPAPATQPATQPSP
jgi:outer membrane protein OmpA-like peptidoglycan-associated protein